MWLSIDSSVLGLRRVEPNVDQANPTQRGTNQDLKHRVATFLTTRHRPALRGLRVEAQDGVVTLRGRVSTFYDKQLSAQLARRVAGVVRLIDDVVVKEYRTNRQQRGFIEASSKLPDSGSFSANSPGGNRISDRNGK